MHLIPLQFSKKHGVLIDTLTKDKAIILYYDLPAPTVLSELRRYLKCSIQLKSISQEQFIEKFTATYHNNISNNAIELSKEFCSELSLKEMVETLPEPCDLLETENDAPIVNLLNFIFRDAVRMNASDIHLEIFSTKLNVRFRIDGLLHSILDLPSLLAPLITTRIKILANLDITEKRLPQDSRITLTLAGRQIDTRISIIPVFHGERIVLRLLDRTKVELTLPTLGLNLNHLKLVQQMMQLNQGLILVTGPTGSGKTTTLYALLNYANKNTRNILTLEDPIEYDLKGIGQTQINHTIGMTFQNGLRSILRQDPDIIMIGEIRDKETAKIAMEASLTGHLVLATLHANYAIATLIRLINLGIDPDLLSASLTSIIAQRLIRLLCQCKEPYSPTQADLKILHHISHPPTFIYKPGQCAECAYTGYKGRTAIYEVLEIDTTLKHLLNSMHSKKIIPDSIQSKFTSLLHHGCEWVANGKTSLEEILRVCPII